MAIRRLPAYMDDEDYSCCGLAVFINVRASCKKAAHREVGIGFNGVIPLSSQRVMSSLLGTSPKSRDLWTLQRHVPFVLTDNIPVVEDDASKAGTAPVGEIFHRAGNIIGGIEGHFFTGGNDQDLLRISLADGCGKTAADHIPRTS